MNNYIDKYLNLNKDRLATRTQVEYRRDLMELERWLQNKGMPFEEVGKIDIQEYLSSLAISNKLKNRKISVFKNFYFFLKDMKVITEIPIEETFEIIL